MRRISAIMAVCAVTTGCTVTTGGAVVPAATLGHAPEPLPASALRGLLLDTDELDTIMGASGLTVLRSGDDMYTNRTPDDACLAAWVNVHENVYAGTGWSAVRRQDLREDEDNYDHIVFQSVVSYPQALDAHNMYTDQVSRWAQCDNKRINERNLRDPDDPDNYWSLATATDKDGVLTMVRVSEGGGGWSCQRALTARNNIVVDVDACADDITDEGARIAERIAEKVSDKG